MPLTLSNIPLDTMLTIAGGGETRATRQQYRRLLDSCCPPGSVLLYQLGNFYEILDGCADMATKKV